MKWRKPLKSIFNSFFKKTAPTPAINPYLPDGLRVYCIGDIHGRYDLLCQLHDKITEDVETFLGQKVIIYLGDFIDRGLHSKDVIDCLSKQTNAGVEYIYLRGNHEQTLLDFLQEDSVGRSWLTYGGQATLASYGVSIAKIPTKREDFIELQAQLRKNLPEAHYKFLVATRLSHQLGNYFFVHAGINPQLPLHKQNSEDMLWIRDAFTETTKSFEKIIVHGHTVTEHAELLANRIGIDTGAYASSVLTCLVLEGATQALIQTKAS